MSNSKGSHLAALILVSAIVPGAGIFIALYYLMRYRHQRDILRMLFLSLSLINGLVVWYVLFR
jgi:uncharacterized membrane-anchored protein